MKAFFAVFFAFALGVSSLFADDVADVKAVIVKEFEQASRGEFLDMLTLRTPDFVEVNEYGTFDYERIKWTVVALDGRHPEEFALLVAMTQFRRPLSPEMIAMVRERGRDPQFVGVYEMELPEIVSKLKADMRHQLKTLKFRSVKVDGDSAVAVLEYRTLSSGQRISTVTLRRQEGAWRFCRLVTKPRSK